MFYRSIISTKTINSKYNCNIFSDQIEWKKIRKKRPTLKKNKIYNANQQKIIFHWSSQVENFSHRKLKKKLKI